jgi:hypothetical protein
MLDDIGSIIAYSLKRRDDSPTKAAFWINVSIRPSHGFPELKIPWFYIIADVKSCNCPEANFALLSFLLLSDGEMRTTQKHNVIVIDTF